MEGRSRDRYLRRSSKPKQVPRSFLDDEEELDTRRTQVSAPTSRRQSRSGSGAGPTVIPATFLDDDEDDDSLLFQRRGRHTRQSSRSSKDHEKTFFTDRGSTIASGTTTPKDDGEDDGRQGRRARSQSIARSRSRYRKALPRIQTATENLPTVPSITPPSAHPQSAHPNNVSAQSQSAGPTSAGGHKGNGLVPAKKLTQEPIPLDVYRQYAAQLQPASNGLSYQPSAESVASRLKTSSSESSDSLSDGFVSAHPNNNSPARNMVPPNDPNRICKVIVVLSKKRHETYNFKHDTTAGELLDWACKKDTMTLRGAAIVVERLPGFGFERALHESEILSTVVDAMECRKEEATLYLDVDVIKSQNLRCATEGDRAHPTRMVANFYYAKGEDANSKIRSKRYFCLDDAKLTMSRRSSRAKTEKSSHVCNIMDYGVYTVGQYGKKRDFDVPSKAQYIIIMKALASKQMFEDQSRFFHFLATDSQDQYFQWVKVLNDWRSFVYQTKEKTKAAETQLIAKLEQEGVSSPEISETKLARLLTETKLTQAKSPTQMVSPGLASPVAMNGGINGTMNPAAFQSTTERPSTGKDSETSVDFLPTGLLGKTYDKKVEIRNLLGNPSDIAPTSIPTTTSGLERKGTLIHKAGQRQVYDDVTANLYTLPKTPKTPKTPIRERSHTQSEERGRQGQRPVDSEMTFYRDKTTSPQQKLRKIQTHDANNLSSHHTTNPISPVLAPPMPLLNFDNEEDEMFKYKKKVTGHGVDVDRSAGPLINHATAEPAINPYSMNGRIPTRMAGGGGSIPQGGQSMPRRSQTLKATSSKKRFEVDQAFESTGLLASVPPTHFNGHGVATGRHGATKPLMDMKINSNFVPGSLLEQHERTREGGPTYKKAAIYREIY